MWPPEQGARITSLGLLVALFLTQPRRLLAACAARAHHWLMLNLGDPRSFSVKEGMEIAGMERVDVDLEWKDFIQILKALR